MKSKNKGNNEMKSKENIKQTPLLAKGSQQQRYAQLPHLSFSFLMKFNFIQLTEEIELN